MTELGKKLKEAREEKGLSLDDLQNQTKIQKRYLRAIEEGRYDLIPGKFYVRAFIKQYAEAVGLDPEWIFEEYRANIPSVYDEELPERLSRTQSRRKMNDASSKFFEIFPRILVAIFVIGAVIILWYLGQKYLGASNDQPSNSGNDDEVSYEDTLPEEKEKKNTGEAGESEKKTNEENKEETPAKEETQLQRINVVGTEGNVTTYELSGTDRFELKLAVQNGKQSWIDIKNGDNRVLVEGMMLNSSTPELVKDFSAEKTVKVKIGAAHVTDVFINGEKLEYALSPRDQIVQTIVIEFNKNAEGEE